MTLHTTGPSTGNGRGGTAEAPVRLRDTAELLAAIPVLLGFRPRESLVVICFGGATGRRIGLTVRVDLPPPEHLAEVCAHLARTVAGRASQRVLLVVVGGRDPAASAPPGSADPPRRDAADALLAALESAGLAVAGRIWAGELTSGGSWRCYDECGCSGKLADPRASAVAAASVAAGRVTYGDRSELARLVAPADAAALARRSAGLDRALDAAALDDALDRPASHGRDLVAVRSAVAEAAAGRLVLGDDDVVRLAAALSDVRVRDACVAMSVGADPGAPEGAVLEQLWAALTRETPDPEAAEPATLLAVVAFLRGDGGLANVALERAQRAWPGHRLSALIDAAIAGGLSPDELRRALDGGASDDRDCG